MDLARLVYLILFFVFLMAAGGVLGACVGEFVGLVIYNQPPLAVYALPVGALVGAFIALGISLAFVAGASSLPVPICPPLPAVAPNSRRSHPTRTAQAHTSRSFQK